MKQFMTGTVDPPRPKPKKPTKTQSPRTRFKQRKKK